MCRKYESDEVALSMARAAGTAIYLLEDANSAAETGVPDTTPVSSTYVLNHPNAPIMSYAEFFRERQQARYATGTAKLPGCC